MSSACIQVSHHWKVIWVQAHAVCCALVGHISIWVVSSHSWWQAKQCLFTCLWITWSHCIQVRRRSLVYLEIQIWCSIESFLKVLTSCCQSMNSNNASSHGFLHPVALLESGISVKHAFVSSWLLAAAWFALVLYVRGQGECFPMRVYGECGIMIANTPSQA
jgi:hypothetical protein